VGGQGRPPRPAALTGFTEVQNGLERERGTAVYKSWTPPKFPLRAAFEEETRKGARDPLACAGFLAGRGVVASLTRSHGAHGFQEQERVRGVRVEAEPR
jgi:hypothetical protein